MLYYLIYSISFLFIWMFLFLDVNNPSLLNIFIGMLYTYYSSYIIRSFVPKESNLLKAIKLAGPLFYLIVSFFMLPLGLNTILCPITIGFVLFCVPFFDTRPFPKKSFSFL